MPDKNLQLLSIDCYEFVFDYSLQIDQNTQNGDKTNAGFGFVSFSESVSPRAGS